MTYSTTAIDGLIYRTGWDDDHVGPIELLVTIDPNAYPDRKGITQDAVRRLSLQSLVPPCMRIEGALESVGAWLDIHHERKRGARPEDPDLFYAHAALYAALAAQEGVKGVTQALAGHANVRPNMARLWLGAARKRGLLTSNPGGKSEGRMSGTITEKARSILTGQSTIWRAAA